MFENSSFFHVKYLGQSFTNNAVCICKTGFQAASAAVQGMRFLRFFMRHTQLLKNFSKGGLRHHNILEAGIFVLSLNQVYHHF